MNTCATCQWMQPYATGKPEDGDEYMCMYNPPIVVVVRNSVVTLRPFVLATDRCSEWSDGSTLAERLEVAAIDGLEYLVPGKKEN